MTLLALRLARELERCVVPSGLTVADALDRLQDIRLVCPGGAKPGRWRMADGYPEDQALVLAVLPKLPAPQSSRQPEAGAQLPLAGGQQTPTVVHQQHGFVRDRDFSAGSRPRD